MAIASDFVHWSCREWNVVISVPPHVPPENRGGDVKQVSPLARWQLLAMVLAVAILAMVLRLPAGGESFWVDELHTAWVVDGPLSEVHWRAAAGNQTPWYFWGLWVWKQVFGDDEVTLRASSMLMVSVACGLLGVAIARRCGLLFGLVVGVWLAIDGHAVFFGTELRSYAAILLATVMATWGWLEVGTALGLDVQSTTARTQAWGWKSLAVTGSFMAVLLHPTAAIVISLLPVCLLLRHRKRDLPQSIPRADVVWPWSGILISLVALSFNWTLVSQVWSTRQRWASFGIPESWTELLTIWNWEWLLVLGLFLPRLLLHHGARTKPGARTPLSGDLVWLRLLLVAILATIAAYLLAAWLNVPIWHRRYFIGVLPLLVAAAGCVLQQGFATLQFFGHEAGVGDRQPRETQVDSPAAAPLSYLRNWRFFHPSACVAVRLLLLISITAPMGLVAYRQSIWPLWQQAFCGSQTRVALRAEQWREAVHWVNQHRHDAHPVYVGAELIESSLWTARHGRSDTSEHKQLASYLTFPLSGPYRIDDAMPLGPAVWMHDDLRQILPSRKDAKLHQPQTIWLIYRLSQKDTMAAYQHANVPQLACEAMRYTEGTTQPFGHVTVVRLTVAWPTVGD